MNIETLDVRGFQPALHGMRNPMNSWEKSDTYTDIYEIEDPELERIYKIGECVVGAHDKELSLRLQKAGPEHCKHLRMIMVWADITAPRFWWQEFDTYRNGVEKVSCSTMHKLVSRLLMPEDFEGVVHPETGEEWLNSETIEVIGWLNYKIDDYKAETDPEKKKYIWEQIVHLLPQSYLQKRTVMMSYAALRNIVRQREGHKLPQWKQFIDWAKGLPNSWMIFE